MDFFNFVRSLNRPAQSYVTPDSKIMKQLEEDKAGYRCPAAHFVKARIESFETYGFPWNGRY